MIWNDTSKSLEILDEGYHTPSQPPTDKFGNPKNPIDELENIIAADGRGMKRVITINGQFVGPPIKVRQGAVVKLRVFR